MKKRIISTMLCIVMLISSFSICVFAEEPVNTTNKKTNLVILIETDTHMEYTYEDSGKSYMIKEDIILEKNEVLTKIFVKNKQEEYELVNTYNTKVVVDAEGIKVFEKQNDDLINTYSIITTRATPHPPADGKAGWAYATTVKGSTKIYNMSISAIKTVLRTVAAGLGTKLFGGAKGLAAAAIAEIASDLFLREADYAYYKQSIYYYFPQNSKVPTRGKTFTSTYADSKYNVYLGDIKEEFDVILGGN